MGPICIGLFPSQYLRIYPSWAPDPSVREQHVPRIDECGNIHHRAVHTLSILSDTPNILVTKHDHQPTTIDYNKIKPYLGWANAEPSRKPLKIPLNGLSQLLDSHEETLQIKVPSLQHSTKD